MPLAQRAQGASRVVVEQRGEGASSYMQALGPVVDDVGRGQLVIKRKVLGGLGRGNGKAVDQVAPARLPLEHQGEVDVGESLTLWRGERQQRLMRLVIIGLCCVGHPRPPWRRCALASTT